MAFAIHLRKTGLLELSGIAMKSQARSWAHSDAPPLASLLAMRQSKIEWTESIWNPVTGCTKLSAGCLNCYAERMAKRLQAMGQPSHGKTT